MVDVPTVGVDPNVGAGVEGTSPYVGAYVFTTVNGEGEGGSVLLDPLGAIGMFSVVGGSVSLGTLKGAGVGSGVLHMSTYSQRPFMLDPTATLASQQLEAESYDAASGT